MSVAHEDPVDALFGLPPEDFTAARDALAKRLRAEGHAEAARTVRQLRRPSVAAWAVDQLARAAPEDLQRLLDTGDDLRRSQRAALSGAGGGRLREATARRRALLAELTERAAGLLTDAGRSPDPHRAAIAGTLEAATVDDEAADLVRSGRLSRELPPPSGFGDLTGLTLVPDAPAADADAPAAGDDAEAADAQIAEAADADPADATPAAADSAGAASEEADGHRAAASRAGDPDTAVEPGAPRQAPETAREQKEARKRAAEQERERVARVAAEEEEAAARDRADVAEAAAAGAEEEATTARGRADAAVEAMRDLERRLSEARREREEAERTAVASESSAYRARRAAVEAAERARAAAARSRSTKPADPR